MAEEQTVLVVSSDRPWIEAVQEALAFSGVVIETAEEVAASKPTREGAAERPRYALVIADAATSEDATRLIRRIRREQPGARIAVATDAPTWRLARNAFRAGATEYIIKSRDRKKLAESLRAILG